MNFRTKTSWVVGLTGPILSGKSTALDYFAKAGADTISCDEMIRTLYTRPAVLRKIKAALGTADKAQLADLVFKHAAKRKALEQILHPLVAREVQARLKKCTRPLVVIEVPLLFEAGWDKGTDLTICVLAAPTTLAARLRERGLTRAEYMRRLQHQLPGEEKARRADIVFFHTDKAQLQTQVMQFCRAINLVHKKQ